jgi:tetratricopeptide (TPR) repeat protein
VILLRQGKYDEADAVLAEVRRFAEQIGDRSATGRAISNQGFAALKRGHLDVALPLLREGYRFASELNDKDAMAISLVNRGLIAWKQSHSEEAEALFEKALKVFDEIQHWLFCKRVRSWLERVRKGLPPPDGSTLY